MTDIAKIILDKYQVRRGKVKAPFIDWAIEAGQQMGYTAKIEKGRYGVRNLVFGDPEKASVVFTAHYDTCARLPFPNFVTPKCMPVYILYSLAICIPIMLMILLLPALAVLMWPPLAMPAYLVGLTLTAVLLVAGPANRHNANDNTSGVVAVFDTMAKLPAHIRENAAFILFDHEEAGMVGSSAYYSAHKDFMKDKLLINFDCVSDGNNILMVAKGKSKIYAPLLDGIYGGENPFGLEVEVATSGVFYPSDQVVFPLGVGVASLKKSKGGILYMNRIHTPKDTVFSPENLRFLSDRSVMLVEVLAKAKAEQQ